MAVPADDFWGPNHHRNPPLTDADIRSAEAQLGVRLPAGFVALLRRQNGGYTKGFVFPVHRRTSWAVDHVPLMALFGIVTDPDHDGVHNLLLTEYLTAEWGLPPRQVLLTGDGHWWISLDYRATSEPTIAWIDVEVGEDFVIAPSFDMLLAGLVPSSGFPKRH